MGEDEKWRWYCAARNLVSREGRGGELRVDGGCRVKNKLR
jgi:hypothetical protein